MAAADQPLSGGVLVVGGGVVGAAVARVAARTRPVIVGSRTPRAHAGLWRRYDLRDPLPADLPADTCVIVAASAPEEQIAAFVRRAGRRVVTLGARVSGASASLLVSPAWDLHERSLQPVLDAMRQGQTGRLPRGLPFRRWIWAEDAARAALDLRDGEHLAVQGPVSLDGAGSCGALALRERGTCGVHWLRSVTVPADPGRDDWDDARWGVRRRL